MTTKEIADEITQEMKNVFLYLNELRDSGTTNMFGATPYIVLVMTKQLKTPKRFMKKSTNYKTELMIVLMLAFFVLVLNALNIYINV